MPFQMLAFQNSLIRIRRENGKGGKNLSCCVASISKNNNNSLVSHSISFMDFATTLPILASLSTIVSRRIRYMTQETLVDKRNRTTPSSYKMLTMNPLGHSFTNNPTQKKETQYTPREEALMGRRLNGDDPTTLHSIALLQERFKQLERTKEMREERDLLRVFVAQPEVPNLSQPARHEQSKWFLHSELVNPSRPLISPSPSSALQLHSHSDRGMELDDCETSLSIGLWPHRANKNMDSPKISKGTEVDTSLHL